MRSDEEGRKCNLHQQVEYAEVGAGISDLVWLAKLGEVASTST